jgi:hypothetical protein
MASTLGDLKTRIITEVNRDDLADDLANELNTLIAQAIDEYAVTPFWFNSFTRTDVNAVAGSQYVTIPDDVRDIQYVWVLIGGTRYIMRKLPETRIISLYTTPINGQPTDFSQINQTLHVWPTPNVAYPLILQVVEDVSPALDYSDDTSANAWTDTRIGQPLIKACVKKMLYRDQLRDADGYSMAKSDEDDAYSKLRGESNKRLGTGRVAASW